MSDRVEQGKRVAPAQARAALKSVVERGASDNSPPATDAVLAAMLSELELARHGAEKKPVTDCPHCGQEAVAATHAAEHQGNCPRHPAVARLQAAFEALELVPVLAVAHGRDAVPVDVSLRRRLERALVLPVGSPVPHFSVSPDYSLRTDLEDLADPRRDHSRRLRAEKCRQLARAAEYWERLLHRETDPCRLCGEVVALDLIVAHADRCVGHPAGRVAATGEAFLAVALGYEVSRALMAHLLERDRYIAGLEALLMACSGFETELGWAGEGIYYARSHDEAALRRAFGAAAELAKVEPGRSNARLDPALAPTAGPDLAEPALEGLGREMETARAALARLARDAREFVGSFGDDDRGRGVVYPHLMPKWISERKQAQKVLDALRGGAGTVPPDGEFSVDAAPTTETLTEEEQLVLTDRSRDARVELHGELIYQPGMSFDEERMRIRDVVWRHGGGDRVRTFAARYVEDGLWTQAQANDHLGYQEWLARLAREAVEGAEDE